MEKEALEFDSMKLEPPCLHEPVLLKVSDLRFLI